MTVSKGCMFILLVSASMVLAQANFFDKAENIAKVPTTWEEK